MLRHLRRDRFAPHLPLEREHREAAFADDDTKNFIGPVQEPKNTESHTSTDQTGANLNTSVNTVRQSFGSILPSPESKSFTSTLTSPHALRAILDLPLTRDEEARFTAVATSLGIESTREDIQKSLEIWVSDDPERLEQAMHAIVEDQHLVLALLRGMQEQAEDYKSGIAYIQNTEHLENDNTDAAATKRANAASGLKRYDVYARIMGSETGAAMMSPSQNQASGLDAVRRWIDQASPAELERMGIPMEATTKTGRLAGIFQDARKALTRGARFWGSKSDGETDDERRQMDFFAVVNKQIVSLKRSLAERIQNDAQNLNNAARQKMTNVIQDLGITEETTLETHPEVWEAFARSYNADFSVFLAELGGTQAELERTCANIDTSVSASHAPIHDALAYLEDMRGKDLWTIALERAQARTESVRSWSTELVRRYPAIQAILANPDRRRAILTKFGNSAGPLLGDLDRLVDAIKNPDEQLDTAALENVQRSLTPLLVAIEGIEEGEKKIPPESEADLTNLDQRFREILPRIASCVACAYLGADEALRRAITQCKDGMKRGEPAAHRQLTELKRVADLIDTIKTERIPSEEPRKGYVRFREMRIIINPTKCRGAQDERIVEDHEFGHLVLHILTEETGLLQSDFDARIEHAPQVMTGDGRTLTALLAALASQWGFPARRQAVEDLAREKGIDAEKLYQRKVLEEAYCRYGTYRKKRKEIARYDVQTDRQFTANERALFSTLEHIEAGAASAQLQPAISTGTFDLQSNLDVDADPISNSDNSEASKVSVTTLLNDIEQSIDKIRNFMDAFPDQKAGLEESLKNIEQFYSEAKKAHQTQQRPDGTALITEENEEFKTILTTKNNRIKKEILDSIDAFDKRSYDLTKQPHGRRNWWQYITKDIQWLSIMDYVQMAKEASEDIQRLWKRRGEQARAKVGTLLTSWISNKVPYIGQLQYEFNRRAQSSELDAVGVWKKALENVDPYTMQESLSEIRNADHLKAILMRLTELGRLNWDDVELWRALGRLSHFQMPEEPCKRDQQLRDFWLKKCIEDIWTDKSLYYDWKQANDGSYNSGKSKFTTTADDLSNISGGLAARMEMQLRMFKRAKDNNEKIPNDVNPHIYEECLHYAIRNGKCSMEQKLYYLVRGVASGLLPLDRLRYLAGEGGKVLNVFPFIDYFYGHNNTVADLKRIEKMIIETVPGKEFAPGPQTTLWFNLEVLRDPSVRTRISKAISGERAQNIDHEDYPGLMSQADFTQIEELTGAISGTRQKQSYEAMKNAYLGFTMRFKTLGRIASLHQRNGKFGKQEVHEASQAILAYVHYDNIMTRNGWDKKERGKLEWNKYDEECPSSGGKTVHQVRDTANAFIVEIFNALEARNVQFQWPSGVTKDSYLRMMTSKALNDDEVEQRKIFLATRHIAQQMETALMNNQDILRNALASRADDMLSDNANDFTEQDTMEFLGKQ